MMAIRTITLGVMTLIALSSAANPKLRTFDNNIQLEVPRGGDVVFVQSGGYTARIGDMVIAQAQTEARVATATAELQQSIASAVSDLQHNASTTMDSVQAQIVTTAANQGLAISDALRAVQAAGNRSSAQLAAAEARMQRTITQTLGSVTSRLLALESNMTAAWDTNVDVPVIHVNVTHAVGRGGFSSFTRHRCTYTGANPNGSSQWKRVSWSDSTCTDDDHYRGVPRPRTNCESMLSWTSQSGPDESYQAFRPDEIGGARIQWKCQGGCSSARPSVRAFYYCFTLAEPASTGTAGAVCAGTQCTANEWRKAALAHVKPQIEALYPTKINSFTRATCSVRLDDLDIATVPQGGLFYKFTAANCTGNTVPTGLCDAASPVLSDSHAHFDILPSNPLDPDQAGIRIMSKVSESVVLGAGNTVASVSYHCYGDVDVRHTIVNSSDTNSAASAQSVHRCKVPKNTGAYIRHNGISSSGQPFTHRFAAADCTNGLPQGDCDAVFSKVAQDGEDEGFMAYPPSEGGARVSWLVTNPGAREGPDIEILCATDGSRPRSPGTRARRLDGVAISIGTATPAPARGRRA